MPRAMISQGVKKQASEFVSAKVAKGSVLVSQPSFATPELAPLPPPDIVSPGRYHLYRRLI